ncbi:uncharacterized protein LOC122087888 [Macadamia integrifolia]|uniref:uncharacterized protein LOC122087888 n=1 Tax=Macadamia integrifolia TaxID=60698 RepID=UPI001C4FCA55|nr:uncharacterized protein LOC122087888 [Macadamia integrifolia]
MICRGVYLIMAFSGGGTVNFPFNIHTEKRNKNPINSNCSVAGNPSTQPWLQPQQQFLPQSFSLLSVSLFFCDVSASVLKGNGDLIQQTCKKTDNYTLCVSLLQSDPRTALKSNLNGLLNIFIDIAIKKAASNKLYVDRLLKAAKDEEFKQFLDLCKNGYVHSISHLRKTLPELKSKTYRALQDDLFDARLAGEQCVFSGPICNVKLYSRNEDFDHLCNFGLKVVDLIYPLIDPNHKPLLV